MALGDRLSSFFTSLKSIAGSSSASAPKVSTGGFEAPGRNRLVADTQPNAIYAIGDVHGCHDLLKALEDTIQKDAADIPGEKWIVNLGDYVDRGPKSAQVLDYLRAKPPKGFRRICLAGNHEDAMLTAIRNPQLIPRWLSFGGNETMQSYGVSQKQLDTLSGGKRSAGQVLEAFVPEEHVQFLESLAVSLSAPNAFFVHAGVRPGIAFADQTDTDMLWIRDEFLNWTEGHGAVVVHGHSPVDDPFLSSHRINVDTGAFATGVLTAVRIDAGGTAKTLQVRKRRANP